MRLAAPEVLAVLREEYRGVVEHTERELQKLAGSRQPLRDQELHRLRRRLLVIERDQVMQAFQQGVLGRHSQERLLTDIDARLLTGNEPAGVPPGNSGATDAQ